MRQWLRRLFCAHSWIERELAYSDFEIGKKYDGYTIWVCARCSKRIFRRSFDPPISFVG